MSQISDKLENAAADYCNSQPPIAKLDVLSQIMLSNAFIAGAEWMQREVLTIVTNSTKDL